MCLREALGRIEEKSSTNVAGEPTKPISVEGRCLCGGLQYHIEGEAFGIIYCHCQRCRKQTGASLVGFVILQDGMLNWKSGDNLINRYRGKGRHAPSVVAAGLRHRQPAWIDQ